MAKKLFFLVIMALTLLTAGAQQSADTTLNVSDGSNHVTMVGDTLLATDGTDTVRVVGADWAALVKGLLSDTVINRSHDDSYDKDYLIVTRMANVARLAVMWIGLVLLVLIIAVVYYKNRRNKYRMIEKAIDNNYQLPPELLGQLPQQVQQPAAVTPPPFTAGSQATGMPPVPNVLPSYDGAVKLIAIGAAVMLFFAVLDVTPMVALSAIPLFLGIGKAFLTWQARQDLTRGGNN